MRRLLCAAQHLMGHRRLDDVNQARFDTRPLSSYSQTSRAKPPSSGWACPASLNRLLGEAPLEVVEVKEPRDAILRAPYRLTTRPFEVAGADLAIGVVARLPA